MKIHYRRKTDMIYLDQHIHYMQVVCNFPVKIKFWREIILAMTFACICYVGDPCVTFLTGQAITWGRGAISPQYAIQEWNIGVCTFHRKWTFCILGQIFRQIVSIRVVTLINTNVVASRHIKREEVLLPVAVRRSKTPELKLNFIRGKENVTHSAQSEFSGRNGFFGGEFPV